LVILRDFFRKNAYFVEEKCGKWKEQRDILTLIMSIEHKHVYNAQKFKPRKITLFRRKPYVPG